MIFGEPAFWVDLAFAILAVGVFVKAKPRIKAILDEKIKAIARELSEARDLREASFRSLAEVQFRDKNAESEVDRVLQESRVEVESLRRQFRKQREAALRLARVRAKEKVLHLERSWEVRLRGSISMIAFRTAESVLLSALRDGGVQGVYFERAVRKIPRGWGELE